MARIVLSIRQANIISISVLILSLLMIGYGGYWWPGIVLAIGITLLTRQFLRGRPYDAGLSALLFGGWYLSFATTIPWQIVMPVILAIGSLTLLFREYAEIRKRTPDDFES